MYFVCYMKDDGAKGFMASPINMEPFPMTEEEAWSCVHEKMSQEDHPRFMWLEEAPECKSLTT